VEIDMLRKIERFGVEAILGRKQLYHGELNRMVLCENIVTAYHSRKSSSWAEWAEKQPRAAALLAGIEKIIDEQ
jgi:hypothetical protein